VVIIQHAGCGQAAPEPVGPDPGPTPFAGFLGRARSFQAQLELGYPFLELAFTYAFSPGFALGAGLRTLYGMTYAPYLSLRFGLARTADGTGAISLALRGGLTFLRGSDRDPGGHALLVGGRGVFGEIGLAMSTRRRRNGLFLNVGLRLSQSRIPGCSEGGGYDCWLDNLAEDDAAALATLFFDLGWEVRITQHASYFIGFGVDLFVNSRELPAMVRFRNGVILDF
jgi:hypothetical protein